MPPNSQDRAARTRDRGLDARYPGLWQAGLIAALAALTLGVARMPRDTADGPGVVSRVAEVAPAELPQAIATVGGSRQALAAPATGRSCGQRLAWVTIMNGSGGAGGRIRLRSGAYVSPAFALGPRPVRVALPYPAPYETGHGTIAVLGATAAAVVALQPGWLVAAGDHPQLRAVTWSPAAACRPGGGA